MRKFGSIAFALALGGLITALASGHSVAYTGEKLAKGAKVSIEQRPHHRSANEGGSDHRRRIGDARKVAAVLRYSFDIKSDGATFEVGVDAQTGKVLENKKEGPHPD